MSGKLKAVVLGQLGLTALGCASAGVPENTPPPEAPVVEAPLDGANYVVFYLQDAVLRRRDTRDGSDLPVASQSTSSGIALSAAGRRTSIVRSVGGPPVLYLVGDAGEPMKEIHRGAGGIYSFAWSSDGTRLAFALRPGRDGSGSSGVWILTENGQPESVGCRAANRVHAWGGEGRLVVGDDANVYTVSATDCATLTTLPRRGKQDFSYAAQGNRLSFFRNAPQGAELYIANPDGSGALKIADPQVMARDVQWAPDGSRVAFQINSLRFADRSHIAVYDVAARRVAFNDRETPLGVPIESNPCWSPDSRRLLVDRVFRRSDGEQTYQMRQKIIKTGSVETMVFEELRRAGVTVATNPCRWLDDARILITSNEGFRVVNVDSRNDYVIGEVDGTVIVQVHD